MVIFHSYVKVYQRVTGDFDGDFYSDCFLPNQVGRFSPLPERQSSLMAMESEREREWLVMVK